MTDKTTLEAPHTMWCTMCGVRLRDEDIKGWGCPKCGCQGIPCSPDKDVFVQVNWHELHILTCWAERWAEVSKDADDTETTKQMSRTVSAIARRLEQQWPTFGPLTLAAEISELPNALAEQGINIESIDSNVPLPIPFLSIGPGAVGYSKMSERNS